MSQKDDLIKKMEELEREGRFNEHLTSPSFGNLIPVDKNYRYIHKGFKQTAKDILVRIFIETPFRFWWSHWFARQKTIGRENIKGIKHAVVVSNHCNIFDCGANITAFRGKKLYPVAASFNNFTGLLGDIMRAGRMLPLGENTDAMKNFNLAIKEVLTKKGYVLFYPEQALWWYYKKPRPFMNGAFHYAVKHKVPVIPSFITFKDRKKVDKDGFKYQKFIVNILEPIYPDPNLNNRENVEMMKQKAYDAMKKKYEEFYGIPLTYLGEEEKN